MATVLLGDDSVTIRFSTAEKILGLVRDRTVPLSAVQAAEAVPDALSAVHGLRAPGLGLPGLRKIGTWRRPGERSLVCVRHGQPALRLTLSGQHHDTALIGLDDAAGTATAITGRLGAAR